MNTDFVLYRGGYQKELLTFTDPATAAAIDLTGCTVTLEIWHRLDDTEPAMPFKVSATGIAHSDQTGAAKGQAVATFDPLDTVNLHPGPYWIIVWIRDPLGHPQVAFPPQVFPVREAKDPAP